MPHILAIDQGTTSTRVIVFDTADARPVAAAQADLKQHYPQPGWVEHDPLEIASSAITVAREAVEKAGLRLRDIAAVGIANQRETTVLWERATGRPIGNAIVWQCRRTADLCRKLNAAGHAADIKERTGLVIDPYFSATKLRWLLDNAGANPQPGRGPSELQRRAEAGELCFGTIDSWLIFCLTGGGVGSETLSQRERAGVRGKHRHSGDALHATDSTNASRTMLLNLHDLAWDPALLSLFDIPEAVLPEVRPSASDFGMTSPEVFGAEVPITGVAGDQHAALYGQACFDPGMAKCTYGTGAFVLGVTGPRPPAAVTDGKAHGLLATLGWQAGTKRAYALEGSVFVTGAAVQWLRDGLGTIATAAETQRLAESVDSTGGVYFVPAFVGLGAPHWDDGARGIITGITRGTDRAHLARAALEAAAYQVRDVVETMDAAARRKASSQPLRADGGQTANEFLMQFQADILGRPVQVAAVPESTAQGAALLAGRGAGIWRSERDLAGMWQPARTYEPQISDSARQSLIAGWNDAVRRARLLAH